MRFRRHVVFAALTLAVLVSVTASVASSSRSTAIPAGDWQAFGRTPDNSRLSPLTQITPANVSQLERVYNIDFQKIDPDVRRGQQSYPLAIGGRLYVTTNDDNVFALEGATGKVIWQYKPPNSGMFKNFGIAANRGLAYCDGKLFISQLDMKLVALRPSDGKVLGVTALGNDVPNANSNYGYSETSAPICANHRLIVGAAGSEYGIRGFVMAYTTDLKPAWPSAFWTVPPDFQSWRRASRIVGGGAVWTPTTVDTTTNTLYLGTGSATPLYFPGLRPGANPRTDSLIAVDLTSGRMKWWQQLLSGNQWAYDVSQPPLVYTGKVGGKTHRVVSVATMEGVWFAFDAATGQPFHERVKVIDRVEHPPLRPGQPVTVFPSSLGGLNYSPAAYDPTTNYVFNAAAETAAVLIQKKLTPTQKKRKFVLGDVYLGLENGSFGTALQNWHDHGSISAIDVSTGRRVWKFSTPEPERGGVSLTASGLGFAGGGDGLVRAFALKTGKVLWTFNTTRPIASGPTIFSADGKEYVAVTVGGTPTSSNGGVASWLQVFALPGRNSTRAASSARVETHPVTTIGASTAAPRSTSAAAAAGNGAHRAAGRRCAARPLAGRELERGDSQRPGVPRREAGRRCAHGRRPLRVAPDHRRARGFQPACRQDAAAASSSARRRRIARTRRRTCVDECRAERAPGGERGHLGRVSPGRPEGPFAEERHGCGQRPRRARRRRAGARCRLAELPAGGNRHRFLGTPRAGRDRCQPYDRPRLLDVLAAVQRERSLRVVLLRLRRAGERPGAVERPGRGRSAFLQRRARRTSTSSG